MLEFVKTEQRNQSQEQFKHQKRKFLCKICQTVISEEKYLLVTHGETPYHTFRNPLGLVFNIVTLSYCEALCPVSTPTSEETWFSGFTWTIECCVVCREHLGWCFEGTSEPYRFYGLVYNRLESK
ncbi:cereblon family protein [Deltaproteobacteria bacterium TL4]